jgi:hypothetical protein
VQAGRRQAGRGWGECLGMFGRAGADEEPGRRSPLIASHWHGTFTIMFFFFVFLTLVFAGGRSRAWRPSSSTPPPPPTARTPRPPTRSTPACRCLQHPIPIRPQSAAPPRPQSALAAPPRPQGAAAGGTVLPHQAACSLPRTAFIQGPHYPTTRTGNHRSVLYHENLVLALVCSAHSAEISARRSLSRTPGGPGAAGA